MANKTGIASAVVGFLILLITWYVAFFHGGATPLVQSFLDLIVNGLVVGGFAWLGAFLLVLGMLILVI
ncbi:hypothetical protein HY995_05260 [Candidatus Micrarchaeota archaeon]|nr:hypothetical protein [Candidatus Micrarchaeota archaeon]